MSTAAWQTGALLLLCAGLVGLLTTACATVTRTVMAPPEIEGATFVGNAVCADCHTNLTRVFGGSAHGRYYRAHDLRWAGMTGCESCHGPGSKHVAAGGHRDIVNPRQNPAVCFQCHLETQGEFNLPRHHPVPEGRLTCVDCHDPHGIDVMKPAGGLAMARRNETCAACHREQVRPFVYDHEALREGCTVCHAPHGAVHDKLLLERDSNLCLKCHAQVQVQAGRIYIGKADHTDNLKFGACFSAGCHTAVHGSNVSPKLRY